MVVVDLALASICFMGSCYPALVGNNTPTGAFPMTQQRVAEPGYGGDLLVFKENEKYVWAVHRVYVLRREEQRLERLRSDRAELRRSITSGCINVMPEVYKRLVDCCSRQMLVIR